MEPPAVTADTGFEAAAHLVLDYLNDQLPMGFWSITRVENDRQTYLYLDENTYDLHQGGSHPWPSSYCVRMVAGAAPRMRLSRPTARFASKRWNMKCRTRSASKP